MTVLREDEPRAVEPAHRLRRVVVGRPMQTGQLEDTLLPKTLALPIFASDPLSSVAYATESGLVVLVAAAATAAIGHRRGSASKPRAPAQSSANGTAARAGRGTSSGGRLRAYEATLRP